jgi:hypothetical protein
MNTPRPVLIMNSVLAGLTFIGGGAALADVIPATALGIGLLVLGGVQIGWATYTQGQVTPLPLVAARLDTGTGAIVAGPAAPGVASAAPGSTSVGDVVDVTKAAPFDNGGQWGPDRMI